MRCSWTTIIESLIFCCVCVLWCEYGYYFYTFYSKCQGWPEPPAKPNFNSPNLTHILVISDTHIMGSKKSIWIDKLRREWQMSQSFKISNKIFQPDVIIFLGDILDEGSFSYQDKFESASRDFERIFLDKSSSSCKAQKRIILLGNHDVGEHDRMITFPFLLDRFNRRFGSTTSAELTRIGDLNIVSVNSMAIYNDSCPFCRETRSALRTISKELAESSSTHSRPLVLTHFPLYRNDDTVCEYPKSMSEKVKRENVEGVDVLHKHSSNLILDLLRPRLILSGHTHMDCSLRHPVDGAGQKIEELTVSSYSHKYAEDRPSFLLISANSTQLLTKRCGLVDEYVILTVYILTFATIVYRLSSNRA